MKSRQRRAATSVPGPAGGRRNEHRSDRRAPRQERSRLATGIPPLRLAFLLTVALAALSALPRIRSNPWLAGSFWGATTALLVMQLVLRWQVDRSGRTLRYEFVPLRVHWVQALMQSCVYLYWAAYWPPVYGHVPLIAAQLLFVYALGMLVSWFRRDDWILGFGPFPIVFATNLFMWFKDDWFFLQFLLVATGVLGKELLTWTRDGRKTHIFNPSTFALFLFSLGLIATGSTEITWGPQIAATLFLPPNIYVEIFVVGLVVQALFSVTLVTLSAAATLYFLNVIYTAFTGTYWFLITNIPIAVFLGLHLLVTDPATSPRTPVGKILFGGMYGLSSFLLFGVLGWLGVPTFYDKLLIVPALNLTVRWLDRTAERLELLASVSRAAATERRGATTVLLISSCVDEILVSSRSAPRRLNWAAMAAWAALFVVMAATGFIGRTHPGRDPELWRSVCEEGRRSACTTWVTLLEFSCRQGRAESCTTLGHVLAEGKHVPPNRLRAGKSFTQACNLGLSDGCARLSRFVRADGRETFDAACSSGDRESCFILGELHHYGAAVPQDDEIALDFFRRSCGRDWPRGCGRLGEIYLSGRGTPADPAKALESFEEACRAGHAGGCFAAAGLYENGSAGEKNDVLANGRRDEACRLGLVKACAHGAAAPSAPIVEPAHELLMLGG